MPDAATATIDPALCDHRAGAFIGLGKGADADEAFDDAVDTARYEFGHVGHGPSLASASPDLEVAATEPLPLKLAIWTAQQALAEIPGGVTHAIPVCADGAFRRRRVLLRPVDAMLELPHIPGPLRPGREPVSLFTAVLNAAKAAGLGPEPTEMIEEVDLRNIRERHKVVAVSFKGKGTNRFCLLDEQGKLVDGGPSASDARRIAVATLRDKSYHQGEETRFEIRKVVGRENGDPLMRVERQLVGQRATLRVSYLSAKQPDKPRKVVGWLFYGVDAGGRAAAMEKDGEGNTTG